MLMDEAQAARERAAEWMLARLGANGEPADAETRNSWCRLGWGFSVSGYPESAARVVDWAARERMTPEGDFRAGYMSGQSYISSYPNYWLATHVIGSWLCGRPDLALRTMDLLASRQDPASGGVPMGHQAGGGPPVCDMLSTAQVGLAGLVTGRWEVADASASWVRMLAEQDPAADLVFHSCTEGDRFWIPGDPALLWSARTDYGARRQAYFTAPMGAVLLGMHAMCRGHQGSLEAARRLLDFNRFGTEEQFTDLASVQACKFGWAVGIMYFADPHGEWEPWVRRMTGWFLERQAPDGGWGPSTFADPDPTVADRTIKTAEHVMELSTLMCALGAAEAREAHVGGPLHPIALPPS